MRNIARNLCLSLAALLVVPTLLAGCSSPKEEGSKAGVDSGDIVVAPVSKMKGASKAGGDQ